MERDGWGTGNKISVPVAHGAAMDTGKPYLEIQIQPQPKFRFRYKSEMTGKHGSLLGVYPFHATKSLPAEKNNIVANSNYIQSNLAPDPSATGFRSLRAPCSQGGEHSSVPSTMSTSKQQISPTHNQLISPVPKLIGESVTGALAKQSVSSSTSVFRTITNGRSGPFLSSSSFPLPGTSNSASAFAPTSVRSSSFAEPLCSSSSGTCLPSISANPSNAGCSGVKIYPTVKLHNFPDDAIIRCSLVNELQPHNPHPHVLEMGQLVGMGTAESFEDSTFFSENHYIEIPVSSSSNHTAVFQGLNIIYIGKKGMRRQLLSKLGQLEDGDLRKIDTDQIEAWSLNANLNTVCLYFEAFVRTAVPVDADSHGETRKRGKLVPICSPVVSQPIQHNKSTQTGDLRIVRIDKHTSYCTGDEEVFMLVEKVDKNNIQVKFFQESDKGLEIWKSYGKFNKLDVHHQYAIVFRTPPYRSCDIDTEIYVWLQLERPSDGATSQPIRFKYKPLERLRKMPKRQIPRSRLDYDPSESERLAGPGRPPSSEFDKHSSDPRKITQGEKHQGGNGPSCSHAGRQGCVQKFPCDLNNLNKLNTAKQGRTDSVDVAYCVALSVGEGLHSWAETSDFNYLLHKLRHLLCLIDENGDNSLHAAISNKQSEPFHRILNIMTSSPDIVKALNEQNSNNQTPVSLAVSMDCPDFVLELVERNADLSLTNLDGDNPIHVAVKNNNIPCLRALLCSQNVSSVINRFNYSSMTPLHLSVNNSRLEALDLICRTGANLNVQEGLFGRTPLHLAVEKGSITATMLLLQAAGESGLAKIANVQNYRGDTPLHTAASSGLVVISAILLYYGADPSIENFNIKETDDSEMEDIRIGQTAIDVSANEEVLKIMDGTMKSWERIVKKTYSQLVDSRMEKDHTLSLDSLHIDSGIDIKDHSVHSVYSK